MYVQYIVCSWTLTWVPRSAVTICPFYTRETEFGIRENFGNRESQGFFCHGNSFLLTFIDRLFERGKQDFERKKTKNKPLSWFWCVIRTVVSFCFNVGTISNTFLLLTARGTKLILVAVILVGWILSLSSLLSTSFLEIAYLLDFGRNLIERPPKLTRLGSFRWLTNLTTVKYEK